MKLRAWAFLTVLLSLPFVSADGAPLYQAGQGRSSTVTNFLHGEISAGYQFSNAFVQDYSEQYASSHLRGAGVRALWSPLAWLSAGAEYTRLGKADLEEAWVSSYTLSRIGAVIKFTLSPDTNPRLYLLGGFGRSEHRLEFSKMFSSHKKSQTYWTTGLGVECSVYKSVFVAAEATMHWEKSVYIHPLYKLSSHAQTELQLRAGVRF